MKEIWPDFVLKGRRRKPVPINMAATKLIAKNCAGLNPLSFLILIFLSLNHTLPYKIKSITSTNFCQTKDERVWFRDQREGRAKPGSDRLIQAGEIP